MTRKFLATSVLALAAIGVAGAGLASAEPPAPVIQEAPAPQEPAPAPAPAPAPEAAPLPTTEDVGAMLTKLSDAGISYKEKSNLVENGIEPQEGHGLDHELRQAYRAGELPYNFDVLNVVPTTPGQALANVTITGPKMPAPQTVPLKLVDQGSWVLSHDSAVELMQVLAAH
ncbi:MAG: hypothetical protein ABI307_15110 [Mycobacterium sp.]